MTYYKNYLTHKTFKKILDCRVQRFTQIRIYSTWVGDALSVRSLRHQDINILCTITITLLLRITILSWIKNRQVDGSENQN